MTVKVVSITTEELQRLIREEVRAAVEEAGVRSAAPEETVYLSVAAAAKRAGCSADTIYEWLKSGRLRHRRVGSGRGHFRITIADLDRAMQPEASVPVDDPDALADQILARRRIG